MSTESNVIVFEDTVEMCRDTPRLMDSIVASRNGQRLILERDAVPSGRGIERFCEPAELVLTKHRTFQAAEKYIRSPRYAGEKVCVLNFASAVNPGGGVVRGASAQEECLCRCSTLYFCLDEDDLWTNFYLPHRNGLSSLHNDDLIYTPNVTVFKTDVAKPVAMEEKDWYDVDVISCAAPNLHRYFGNLMEALGEEDVPLIDVNKLAAIHHKRGTRILDVAVENKVDILILGAFGCGAFGNNPFVVSKVMVQLAREYAKAFKTIEFAVYCSRRDQENYMAFQEALGV